MPKNYLKYRKFISQKIEEIKETVGDEQALSVLSGGVDSSTVTVLAYKAIGNKLKTVFIDNGIMRENEPREVANTFKRLGIKVKIIDAKKNFFKILKDRNT